MIRITSFFILITFVAQAQTFQITEKVKFLALGDSYTIGQSVAVNERWPVQLVSTLRARGVECDDPFIIATTGWRTDNLDNAITQAMLEPEYNLVSLLIGVNNYYQGKTVESYKPEFEALLNKAIALAGGNKENVFVVSIPDYGYTPFGKSNQVTISAGIDLFNAANKSITEQAGVTYINITDISRRGLAEPDLVATDGLHPSGKMYSEWVTRILQSATLTTSPVTEVAVEVKGLSFFPNPVTKDLYIENHLHQPMTIKLCELNGQTIQHLEITDELSASLSVEGLASGIYIVSIQYKSHIIHKRILKQ